MKTPIFLLVLTLVLIRCSTPAPPRDIAATFTIQADSVIGKNHGFWKALGYDFLYKIVNEPEGQEFLDRAKKNNSVTYYRSHYTFNNHSMVDERAGGKVGGQVVSFDKNGQVQYDFSIVNKTFREYTERGMKPVVEFDFYPDGFAKDQNMTFNDESFEAMHGGPRDWGQWQKLLDAFMQNLVDEFGVEEMGTWYFEVWNEPDNWSDEQLPEFYRLYDVFAATVKSYSQTFRVGGPGCYKQTFMKGFLDHITRGTNYVTGEKGSPIDFLSVHIYGLSGSWLKPAPDIYPQVSAFTTDMLWWRRLFYNYPEIKGAEVHLNEWGLSSHGDSKFVDKFPQLEYRNSEVSALFMVKLVDCLYAIEDAYDAPTQMMLYWGSWFNAATGPMFRGSRDLMTSGGVPKPILTAYELLAKLGENRIAVEGPKAGNRYGILATSDDGQIQLLVYNFNETDDDFERLDDVKLVIDGISSDDYEISEYWLDRSNHNTYREWQSMNSPEASAEVIAQLKEVAELRPNNTSTVSASNEQRVIKASLPRHSMR
ncbi:MAG: hypothetical protein KI790_16815, partial [Cyclobacteriaceae bacterium]|nr:hypothetical protein [Cyclobacteriaceae bacterium HetDA_MAG_MS6]